MHPQLFLFAFMTLVCAAISSSKSFILSSADDNLTDDQQQTAVSHTPRHSNAASLSSKSFTYPHHSTPTVIYTSCSAEHSCIHTKHPATATAVVVPGSHTTTLKASGRKVELKRPATAVRAPTRYTAVSEDIGTTGMLLPVHRIAESPGSGVLKGSASHTIVAGTGAVGPIETAGILLPVHRVAESPGVGGVEVSMSAGGE